MTSRDIAPILARDLRQTYGTVADSDHFYSAALAAYRIGDRDAAAAYCERALALDPNRADAYELISQLFMQGEDYLQVLARLHRHLRPRTYVEIGVHRGASMALVQPGTLALGVEPQPVFAFMMVKNIRIFRETSDEFFARRDVRSELGGLPVDLALIDGMHHFEFALRDFINLERLCAPGSTILVHDCFPREGVTSRRERVMDFWSGDIWRLVVLLKKYRPDLSIHTIATPPTGLGVIRNLDPASRFLGENADRLCEEFLALDYGFLHEGRAQKLNLFPNDWDKIRGLLN